MLEFVPLPEYKVRGISYESIIIFLGGILVFIVAPSNAWAQDRRWIEDQRTSWFLALKEPEERASGLWLQPLPSEALTVMKGTKYGPVLRWSRGRLYLPYFYAVHKHSLSPQKGFAVLELAPPFYSGDNFESLRTPIRECTPLVIRVAESHDESKEEASEENKEEASQKGTEEATKAPYWLTTDRRLKDAILFGVTDDPGSAQIFVLSSGDCDSDVQRQTLLDNIEDRELGAELQNSIDSAQDLFAKRIAKLTVVSFPLKNIGLDEGPSRSQFYLVQELSAVLKETKQVLTERLSKPWAAALVAYIDLRMPDERNVEQNHFQRDSRLISKAAGDQLVRSVEYLFDKLSTVTTDISLRPLGQKRP